MAFQWDVFQHDAFQTCAFASEVETGRPRSGVARWAAFADAFAALQRQNRRRALDALREEPQQADKPRQRVARQGRPKVDESPATPHGVDRAEEVARRALSSLLQVDALPPEVEASRQFNTSDFEQKLQYAVRQSRVKAHAVEFWSRALSLLRKELTNEKL